MPLASGGGSCRAYGDSGPPSQSPHAEMSFYDDHADLYDLVFSWDVEDEVGWLLEKLGPDVRVILEPGCGSGRMFPGFTRHNVEVIGVELSATMLKRATDRMASLNLPPPQIVQGDMADFDLSRTVDGAICPINTFGYLHTTADAQSHLDSVARHLPAGRKYLVQVDLKDTTNFTPAPSEQWEEIDADGIPIRTTWGSRSFDPDSLIEMGFSRFEILDGPRQGQIVENTHRMRVWNWDTWSALINASAFQQAGAYHGDQEGRPALPLGPNLNDSRLTWHELVRK